MLCVFVCVCLCLCVCTVEIKLAEGVFEMLGSRDNDAIEGLSFALPLDLKRLAFGRRVLLLPDFARNDVNGIVRVVHAIEPGLPDLPTPVGCGVFEPRHAPRVCSGRLPSTTVPECRRPRPACDTVSKFFNLS